MFASVVHILSLSRRKLLPNVEKKYSGYIAWRCVARVTCQVSHVTRHITSSVTVLKSANAQNYHRGVIPESDMPQRFRDFFQQNFTFYTGHNFHILCYLAPFLSSPSPLFFSHHHSKKYILYNSGNTEEFSTAVEMLNWNVIHLCLSQGVCLTLSSLCLLLSLLPLLLFL